MQAPLLDYENQLDVQINHQYHQICFNPYRKQVLNRLLQNNSSTKPLLPIRQRRSNLLDNHNIMVYVNGVYQKYGIEDPIKKHFRLSSRYRAQTTPQKSQNMTQITDSDKLTRTKRRLLSLKDSFKRDSQDILQSSQFTHNNTYQQHSIINQSKMNRQIGYRTKQKMRFKTIPNQQDIQVMPKPSIEQSSKHSERQIIKYCIMCEQKIEQDIQIHLFRCKQGNKATLSNAQLQRHVSTKIQRMQQQISQILFFKNQQNILYRYRDLKSTIHQWINGNQIAFQSIKDKFQFYSLDLFERLSKLNWFRSMHVRMEVGEWRNK